MRHSVSEPTDLTAPPQQDVPQVRYPYVTMRALHLFNEGALDNVKHIDVEPDYGYVTRISYKDGGHRITYGNDLGLNTGSACELAKDKGHTKFMLRTIGVETPEGREFLLPWWADKISKSVHYQHKTDIRTTDEADRYLREGFGYPAYTKPVSGSKGADVLKVYTPDDLSSAFDLFAEKRVKVAIVEKPVDMPDYRIVVLDGELISAYERVPLAVTGTGEHTITELLNSLQQRYVKEGRDTVLMPDDPQILKHLVAQGLHIGSVVPKDQSLTLLPVSNLSKGGRSVEISDRISQRWVDLTAYVARSFNLRLIGLDLACEDITQPDSAYSVLEVNAAPGLDHYALSGDAQQQLVDRLYTKVLNVR